MLGELWPGGCDKSLSTPLSHTMLPPVLRAQAYCERGFCVCAVGGRKHVHCRHMCQKKEVSQGRLFSGPFPLSAEPL